MKNQVNLNGVQTLVGQAKRESKIFSKTDFTQIALTDKSKSFLNRKNQRGEFTKESKEAKLTLVALLQLGAINEENAVSGIQVIKAYESLSNAQNNILNDANKVGRILRSLNNKPSNANREIDSWATPNSIPQSNYFNLNYVYSKVSVRVVGSTENKAEKLTAKYYLARPIDLATLKVRGKLS